MSDGDQPAASKKPFENWTPDERDETVRVSALDEQDLLQPDPYVALSLHRRVAQKFTREGDHYRAFSELMRAAQSVPIDGQLGLELMRLARRTGLESPAAKALEGALPKALSGSAPVVMRCAARLYRRAGLHAEARRLLVRELEHAPDDRQSRRLLCVVSVGEGSFEITAENLRREIDDDARDGRHRHASRKALMLARLFEERLGDPAQASAAYARAAESSQAAGDLPGVFSARVLAARALVASKPQPGELEVSLRAVTEAGRAARRDTEASAIVAELGEKAGSGQSKVFAVLAEAAFARGNHEEAVALLRAAVAADPSDAALALRLENHFIARAAWNDLAALYRERAKREGNPELRAELLTKLAELLEDELGDRAGAAEIYATIVELTGDPAALAAQVRLLSASTDPAAVQGALDAAVRGAKHPEAKAQALLLRGEVHLSARRMEQACADLEASAALVPGLRALAGIAECRVDRKSIERFEEAFKQLGRGASGRVSMARRLARLLEWPLGEGEAASKTWHEVLAESPSDVEAEQRLIELARTADKKEELLGLLRRRLAREPRGQAARVARHELAGLLEQLGRDEEALAEWRMATRMEPGDAVALIALADRCEQRGRLSEAAFALEGAAAATEAGPERAALWLRLAKLSRERLGDPGRAAACEERARTLLEKQGAITDGKKAPPAPAATVVSDLPAVPPPSGPAAPTELAIPTIAQAAAPAVAPSPAAAATTVELEREPTHADKPPEGAAEKVTELDSGDVVPVSDDDIATADLSYELPPENADADDKTPTTPPAIDGKQGPEAEKAAAQGLFGLFFPTDKSEPAAAERKARPRRSAELKQLRLRVDEDPLDPKAYQLLADHYDRVHDPERTALMLEISNALQGDRYAEPLAPRATLSQDGWSKLRHPMLRASASELFGLVGPAICTVSAQSRKECGAKRSFAMNESNGARAVGDALLCAVKVLGVRAPEIQVATMDNPPIWAVNADPATLLVGKLAAGRVVLPAAQLRFFAGRALATYRPEMMALRLVPWDKLTTNLDYLLQAVQGEKPLSAEARALARRIPAKSAERIEYLLESLKKRHVELASLIEGARHTANRAGLIVAGSVAPAVTALRAKRGASDELVELVRFAASNKYLELRGRH